MSPLAAVAIGYSPELAPQAAAHAVLCRFILQNANDTITSDRYPMYQQTSRTTSAVHRQQLILTTDGDVILRYYVTFNSGASSITNLYLTPEGDSFYYYFANYPSRYSQQADPEGEGRLRGAGFTGQSVSFSSFTGSEQTRASAQELAGAMLQVSLEYADELLDSFSGHLCGMSDFGFDL